MSPDEFTKARERLGLDYAGLAAALDIKDARTIYRYEKGTRSIPGPVVVLMQYFGKFGTPEKALNRGRE